MTNKQYYRCFPAIHGHRGARGLQPENSLPAIRAGIAAGSDGIEVDLCVTSDRQLVIHHDPVLSKDLVRENQGNWIEQEIKIFQHTWQELHQYDIGRIKPQTQYAATFDTQTAIDGTRIPHLDDFIELIKETNSKTILNLELKSTPYDSSTTPDVNEYIDLVLCALNTHDIVKQTFLQSFDWRLVIEAKSRMPELKTGFLTNQEDGGAPRTPINAKPSLWTNGADVADYGGSIPRMIVTLDGDVWSANQKDLNETDVIEAHDAGLDVYVWTVNSIEDMQRMIDIGVDAITTDYPNRLYELLNAS